MSPKQLVRNRILQSLLPDFLVVPYLFFWARIVLRARKPCIVGVTGSVGKTTTTEMIAAVLMHRDAAPVVGRAGTSRKNMNDDTGLPLTVLGYETSVTDYGPSRFLMMCSLPFRALRLATSGRYPKVWVLEYGTHWEGHLDRLARLAPPDIAVVTTIGPAHLDRLKTLEGVVQEKGALVRTVPRTGLVVLGEGHDYVAQLSRQARAPVVTVQGRGIELARNITRAVCRRLGIAEHVVAAALQAFKRPKGRLNHLHLDGLTVIDDSYNANPLSMKLGLDTLAETAPSGSRRVAVLGYMGELGDECMRYHQEIGAYARASANVVIGVGELSRHYHPDHWFESSAACARQIERLLLPGDWVLVKGSSSARTAEIVGKLRELGENRTFGDEGTVAHPGIEDSRAPM
jgi:UDP-N-acetylmuramoyl-tripeptide--D-alanyl-D-alanine ligase